MPIVANPDSAFSKEMAKWNAHYTEHGPPGKPFVFHEYPAMMYKAGRVEGKPQIVDKHIAADEDAQRNLESRGFVAGGPGKAMEALESDELWQAKLAAERNYEEARMGPKAQEQARAVNEAAGMRHVPSVPETPIKRRQRKARVLAEAAIGAIGDTK